MSSGATLPKPNDIYELILCYVYKKGLPGKNIFLKISDKDLYMHN